MGALQISVSSFSSYNLWKLQGSGTFSHALHRMQRAVWLSVHPHISLISSFSFSFIFLIPIMNCPTGDAAHTYHRTAWRQPPPPWQSACKEVSEASKFGLELSMTIDHQLNALFTWNSENKHSLGTPLRRHAHYAVEWQVSDIRAYLLHWSFMWG